MLKKISEENQNVLYLSEENSNEIVNSYVFTSLESQEICNNPLVLGIDYTNKLQAACTSALKLISKNNIMEFKEAEVSILNILRGGLNFELRQSFSTAFNFNSHSSIFVSAQRKLTEDQKWIITEDSYEKIDLKSKNQIVFGDVVATGTSLEHSLKRILNYSVENNHKITEIVFFTIGGPRSTAIMKNLYQEFADKLGIKKIIVIYLEGIFTVADESTPYSIKIPGTDLINFRSILAPEFIKSKEANPCYWLERCSIYDAGSRAFNVQEYLEDVIEYWEENKELAKNMSYNDLFLERNPGIDRQFDNNLAGLVEIRLKQLKEV